MDISIPDTQQISSDPFSVLGQGKASQKVYSVNAFSDISDDDCEIPCSQNRMPHQ